jgi:CubicO group peptidase (beta-lactamase class C family)
VNKDGWKRLLRGLSVGVGVVVAIALIVFGWAWLSTDSSTVARALVWMEADVGDQDRFPARDIPAAENASRLRAGEEAELASLLSETGTGATVVVHRDRVVYESYASGSGPETLHTTFSVAKSFVSALVGIAIADGSIDDVDDPVTEYVPELAERDPRFERITLRHLLTMSSGIRYSESGLPWSGDDTHTYYGVDLREIALERTEIDGPPGRGWHYNNYNPLLLGLVLERAAGTSVSEYLSRKLWRPLGAGDDATWSLDSEESGFEKLESGINATALDYARFGLLFLHGGRWNGERVIPESWVRTSTTARTDTDYANRYGYFWWIDGARPENYYALGNYGQYIYVAPDADVVIVRTGSDWGVDNEAWLDRFRQVSDRLEAGDPRGRASPAAP